MNFTNDKSLLNQLLPAIKFNHDVYASLSFTKIAYNYKIVSYGKCLITNFSFIMNDKEFKDILNKS
jgi:hypothetical protein